MVSKKTNMVSSGQGFPEGVPDKTIVDISDWDVIERDRLSALAKSSGLSVSQYVANLVRKAYVRSGL